MSRTGESAHCSPFPTATVAGIDWGRWSGYPFDQWYFFEICDETPLAGSSSGCHDAAMDADLCACGRRPRRQCSGDKSEAEIRVALVRVVYCVRSVPDEETSLQVLQCWWCMQGGVTAELLTTEPVMRMISQPARQTAAEESVTQHGTGTGDDGDAGDGAPEHVREAAAAYLADRLDEALGGARLDDQLWASSSTFLPGAAAETLERTNAAINNVVSRAMQKVFNVVGDPPDVAVVVAPVGADLVLAPISRPLGEAKKIIEVVGLGIAVLTMQPALALACAKAILHDEIVSAIEKSIVGALSSSSAVTEADTTEGKAQAVRPAAQAATAQNSAAVSTAGEVATIKIISAETRAHQRRLDQLRKSGTISDYPEADEYVELNPSGLELLRKTEDPSEPTSSLLGPPHDRPITEIDEITTL
jgi:hypothetical protein